MRRNKKVIDSSYKSILQDLDGGEYMTIDTTTRAVDAVYDVLKERLIRHNIDDIEDEEVVELAEDIVYELCMR